ncbi:MAG: aldehyde ferredoxin oxidoreductase family protein [Dehalococcoidales bacterium]|nr:aldehyde ferredoxin oxidoreductase family protein [Dehalococcoidales bacterium]
MVEQIAGGYNGKILRVNLSGKHLSTETIDELFCRKYLGGAGFISYFLWQELEQGIDPLAPENKLIFALGPVTGMSISGSGRHCIGAKSPLTGGYTKSEVGGNWGAELKRAGYDAIIIEGKAEKPVYLWVNDGEASLKDASHLWGMSTKETQNSIRTELGDNLIRVATIGPGGENLVRFACIINDLHDAAGRGGTGAVMGSKNLKAIGVRGHKAPQVAHPEHLKELRKWLLAHRELWAGFNELGTGGGMEAGMLTGNLPVHNFRDGEFPDASKISAEAVRDTIRINMETCFACPIRCKKVVRVDEPYPVDPAYGGPEYEALASLGSNCGISDLKAIAKANELCNAYSLDAISTGVVIAFAMECFENGLLTEKDTDGIELKFGNTEAMLKTTELIARREGIGSLLAEGTARAARKIGKGAMEFAMQVKGLEIGMHEPRLKAALGLGYSINPHGADHCANFHDTMASGRGRNRLKLLGLLEPMPADELSPRKVSLFHNVHKERIIRDCLALCSFVPWDIEQINDILSAVTGWQTGVVEMMRVAERTLTMARLFNLREGFTAADDKLPERFHQPKRNGVLSTRFYDPQELEKARSYYYTLMGWDARTGIPTPEKLADLGID